MDLVPVLSAVNVILYIHVVVKNLIYVFTSYSRDDKKKRGGGTIINTKKKKKKKNEKKKWGLYAQYKVINV